MRTILIILFLALINLTDTYGQKKIKGKVIDEHLAELMVVQILDSDNNLLGETDFNGFFDITIPNESNKLVFSYIGFELANIELSDSCNYVEIILLNDVIYDFITLREVDKKRNKRFDKLPKLHLEAVKKGIFKNKTMCYSRGKFLSAGAGLQPVP